MIAAKKLEKSHELTAKDAENAKRTGSCGIHGYAGTGRAMG